MSSRRLGAPWLLAGLILVVLAAVTLAAISLRSLSRLAESMESEKRQELAGRGLSLQSAEKELFEGLQHELQGLLTHPEGIVLPEPSGMWLGWSLSNPSLERLGGPRQDWDPDLGLELGALTMTRPGDPGARSALETMGAQKEPVREVYRRMLLGRHLLLQDEPDVAALEFLSGAQVPIHRPETVWCALAVVTTSRSDILRVKGLEILSARAGEGSWPSGTRTLVLEELDKLEMTPHIGRVRALWKALTVDASSVDEFAALWSRSRPALQEAAKNGSAASQDVVWLASKRDTRLAVGALRPSLYAARLREIWSRIPGRHGLEIDLVTGSTGSGEFVRLSLPGHYARLSPVPGDTTFQDEERLLSRSTVAFLLVLLGVGALFTLVVAVRSARESRLKADFVSLVSHELRTPLTSIQMFVETLKEGRTSTDAERQGALGILDAETRRLRGLIERLLSFSILERGVDLRREEVSLNRIGRHALELMRPQFEAAGTRLTGTFPDEELAVVGDGTALSELCLNLLANALAHGRGPEASLTLSRHDGQAVLEVADRGAGLADKARKIFKPFERGASTEPGLGLGLALVQRIAEAHRGHVQALDREGGGALFRVTLPLALDQSPPSSTMEP